MAILVALSNAQASAFLEQFNNVCGIIPNEVDHIFDLPLKEE